MANESHEYLQQCIDKALEVQPRNLYSDLSIARLATDLFMSAPHHGKAFDSNRVCDEALRIIKSEEAA